MLKTLLAFIAKVKDEVFTNQTERIKAKYRQRINQEDQELEHCIRMQKFYQELAARPGNSPEDDSAFLQGIRECQASEVRHRAALFQARMDLERELKLESIVSMPLTGCPRAAMARHLNRF